jgi:hypothetical protein
MRRGHCACEVRGHPRGRAGDLRRGNASGHRRFISARRTLRGLVALAEIGSSREYASAALRFNPNSAATIQSDPHYRAIAALECPIHDGFSERVGAPLGVWGLVGHLLSARQFSECLAAHSAACCLVVKPLITSVSPSGQRISTTQPSPGGLPFLTPKTGRCSDIQRICAYGGPVQASHPATIKLTHYPAIAAFGMRYPWNDALFIGIVRDGTSRLSTRPSGDVSETCRTSRRSCCQKRDA